MHELIKTVNELKAEDMRDLFRGKIVALRIPSYFPWTSGKKASEFLLKHHKVNRWFIGDDGQVLTDMNYVLGIPRQVAQRTPAGIDAYHVCQKTFMDDLGKAFGHLENPLEQFLSTLKIQFGDKFRIADFEGRAGLPAIARYMSPLTLLENDSVEGICHVDSRPEKKMLSANMYMELPESGGELVIWNWPVSVTDTESALYRMITHYAFTEGYRDKIKPFLPDPLQLSIDVGDLIIFDTSKVHAVSGFTAGQRLTLQTFLVQEGDAESVIVRS